MSLQPPTQERFHFLDGLRGIASLMIVFHHSITSNLVKLLVHLKVPFAGFFLPNFTQSGVELFFVLSGVVLLRPYVRKQRVFKTWDYLIRRVKRIYPPYLVALLFAALVGWYVNAFPTWYNTGAGNNIAVYHMDFSLKELLEETAIINFDGAYYNLACWSLSIEVLFYLLVPLCIFIFPSREKINNLTMAAMLLFTLAASVAAQFWLTRYYPEIFTYTHIVSNAYRIIVYPVCFLMGMLLAAKDLTVSHARIFIIAGIIMIITAFFYEPLMHAGYGLFYGGIVILSFNLSSMKRFLSKPLMLWLGERSYSIFLMHFPIFYLTDNIMANFTPGRNVYYGILTRGIGIPTAIFLAMCLFHFVERHQARGLVTGDVFWPWQIKKMKLRLKEHNVH